MTLEPLQKQLKTLRLAETSKYLPDLIQHAESNDWTYRELLTELASYELKKREEKQIERQLKWAAFPAHTTLEMYNLNEQQTLSKKQMKQLSELTWIDQIYNLVLLEVNIMEALSCKSFLLDAYNISGDVHQLT